MNAFLLINRKLIITLNFDLQQKKFLRKRYGNFIFLVYILVHFSGWKNLIIPEYFKNNLLFL